MRRGLEDMVGRGRTGAGARNVEERKRGGVGKGEQLL